MKLRPKKVDIYAPMREAPKDPPGWVDDLKAKFVEKSADGVALNSMAHPDGLIEKIADAIRDGRLK